VGYQNLIALNFNERPAVRVSAMLAHPGCRRLKRLPGGPLRERVLAIVNLIAKYVLGADDAPINEQDLIAELISVGFEVEEINDAFSWMESTALQQPQQQTVADIPMRQPGYRIFSTEEQLAISQEAIGFLVRLRAMGLLPDDAQEEIIDRAVRAADEPINLQEIKLISALTLLSHADSLWQREIDCFLDNDWARIYN
jgi:Smg protein